MGQCSINTYLLMSVHINWDIPENLTCKMITKIPVNVAGVHSADWACGPYHM